MTRDEWIAQIDAKPGDWQMALIAADEIESDGDELFAEQLRFRVQFAMADLEPVDDTHELWKYLTKPPDIWMLWSNNNEWRAVERAWCKANNVRFIPAFPRSLDDVYAGRELV